MDCLIIQFDFVVIEISCAKRLKYLLLNINKNNKYSWIFPLKQIEFERIKTYTTQKTDKNNEKYG
jgi:hypothetical protein